MNVVRVERCCTELIVFSSPPPHMLNFQVINPVNLYARKQSNSDVEKVMLMALVCTVSFCLHLL